MNVTGAAEPGDPGKPMEDWHHADERLVVVLDGATARTEVGCTHGVAWYAQQLGTAIIAHALHQPLAAVLSQAITDVASLHPECGLDHPGTPSAGVGMLREAGDVVEWLVLGDVTVVVDADSGPRVVTDDRIRRTAAGARALADQFLIGSPRKLQELRHMKRLELAARNQPGGYWIAAADPTAATHALTGATPTPRARRAAVLSDGVERLVSLFDALTWTQLLNTAGAAGPQALINRVRRLERHDKHGQRYPRNKASDDATAVYVELRAGGACAPSRKRIGSQREGGGGRKTRDL